MANLNFDLIKKTEVFFLAIPYFADNIVNQFWSCLEPIFDIGKMCVENWRFFIATVGLI